ncbi:sugar ABC transporter permease [Paenibacillus chartarius]|uniref:Sugar ABC transporter permease n=1 Tax=Paenibacillus chartarius TaxID=747481 RepID=A0ABV6DKW5_9BACL
MKKGWLAVLLSFIYPGLGHLYVGNVKRGVWLLVLETVSILLIGFFVGVIMFPIIWIFAMVDAYRLTQAHNRG